MGDRVECKKSERGGIWVYIRFTAIVLVLVENRRMPVLFITSLKTANLNGRDRRGRVMPIYSPSTSSISISQNYRRLDRYAHIFHIYIEMIS